MNLKLGENIRNLRLQHKLTQEQLADRLGVSYQSVSRWENGVTYPDIEYLPPIAKHFSVTTDYLLGQDDVEKRKRIRKQIQSIARMTEDDKDAVIDIIRTCRREQDNGECFADICYFLYHSSAWKNPEILAELRKSKDMFFETCTDTGRRSRALVFYASMEDEDQLPILLTHHSSEFPTNRDYLLKERYLFRGELEKFDTARQHFFYNQVTYLIDGDASLWRDSSKPVDVESALYENCCKLSFIHNLCQESLTGSHLIAYDNPPDVFVSQRIWPGMVCAAAYAAHGKLEKAYTVLEDIITLIEKIMALPDGAEIGCQSPTLPTLRLTTEKTYHSSTGHCTALYYRLENGDMEFCGSVDPKYIYEKLQNTTYSYWNWLTEIRKEARYIDSQIGLRS